MPSSQLRRALEVTFAVGLWVAAGYRFRLSVSAYQLLGVVLVAAFQLLVRRRAMRTLWIREGPAFRLDARGWGMAACLAVCPLFHLVRDLRTGASATSALVHAAALVGSIPAAYALRAFRRSTLRMLLACLAIPGGVGIVMMSGGALLSGHVADRLPLERLAIGLDSFLLYLPLVFVFEEVSFRGAFDAHVQHPGERRGWETAVWVSVLWGLWHVPVTLGAAPLPALIANNVFVCVVIGVPFSIFWRRSGNLGVTGVTHALVDAVRNALLTLPVRQV